MLFVFVCVCAILYFIYFFYWGGEENQHFDAVFHKWDSAEYTQGFRDISWNK